MLLAFAASSWAASELHPAQALIEKAAAAVRTDPEAARRDAEAALAMLVRQPDVDLEVRARTVAVRSPFRARPACGRSAKIAQARALLPRNDAWPGSWRADCEGTDPGNSRRQCPGARAATSRQCASRPKPPTPKCSPRRCSRAATCSGLQGQYAAGLADLKRGADRSTTRSTLPTHALTALNGIAILYNRMGDYAQARDMYDRALKAQRDAGMHREQGVTLHNLGRAHENLLEWDAAQAAFQESYDISRRAELCAGRGVCAAWPGGRQERQGRSRRRAGKSSIEPRPCRSRRRMRASNAQIQLARGIALHQLERLARKRRRRCEEALAVFRQADSLNELRATYGELAAVLARDGQLARRLRSSRQRPANVRAPVPQPDRSALRDA